jgi:hypothetical protein
VKLKWWQNELLSTIKFLIQNSILIPNVWNLIYTKYHLGKLAFHIDFEILKQARSKKMFVFNSKQGIQKQSYKTNILRANQGLHIHRRNKIWTPWGLLHAAQAGVADTIKYKNKSQLSSWLKNWKQLCIRKCGFNFWNQVWIGKGICLHHVKSCKKKVCICK